MPWCEPRTNSNSLATGQAIMPFVAYGSKATQINNRVHTRAYIKHCVNPAIFAPR